MRIALTGKLRSGKSTVSKLFANKAGLYEESFGSSLKYYAEQLLGESEEYRTEDGKKPRKLYQDFGQKMRELEPNIWIRHVEKNMRERELVANMFEGTTRFNGFIIDDLRQPNEYKWAKENGFIIIRVESSDDNRLRRARNDSFTEEDLTHETEQHSDGFEVDYTINNNTDYMTLGTIVDEILEDIQEKTEAEADAK